MIMTSRAIHFGMTEMIKKQKKWTIMTSIKQIIITYNTIGFRVKHVLGYGQIKCIRDDLECKGIILNITAHDEHVPEVEKYIRTIIERTLATIDTVIFEKYPYQLIVEIIYNTVFWLNCFTHKNGIHPPLSARTIVRGTTINYGQTLQDTIQDI